MTTRSRPRSQAAILAVVVAVVVGLALGASGNVAASPAKAPSRSQPQAAATPIGPWSALGSNGAGDGAINSFVYAVAVDGKNVYVGGTFTNAGGVAAADYVAKWNGTSWSALGSNGAGNGAFFNADIRAMAISGGDLYVAGYFENAAGIATADNIAKWDGSTWSALGSRGPGIGPLTNAVHALAVSGSDLYAGGQFVDAGGVATADYVAKWNGTTWSGLGSNGSGDGALAGADVRSLATAGSNVYVGGDFDNVAGIPTADSIARWNGSTWSALGSNGSGEGAISAPYPAVADVMTIAIDGTNLYAGGIFTNAAGIAAADDLAKWNGSSWSAVGSKQGEGALGPAVRAIKVVGSDLYAGGDFIYGGGLETAGRIAKWDGHTWSALGSDGAGGPALGLASNVNALGVTGTDLIVGGYFPNAAGIPTADHIAAWSLVPFTDIAGTSFEDDIIWAWQQGITSGCTATTYCPNAPVSRGQMASFLARALALPASSTDYFDDDNGTTHEANINRVAKAGITTGCAQRRYCPNDDVSRGQMASFLARALALPASSTDYFDDDDGTTHEANINRVAKAGITTGCTATKYCPDADVTRGQMAAFLHRALK